MAVNSLGQLTLDLVARVGGFTEPMERAAKAVKKDIASIAKSFKGAATAITAVTATVAAAGAGIVTVTKQVADSARELQNQAGVANAGVEEFQRFAYASKAFGVEQEKLGDILKDVNDRVGDFITTGGGEMADFFENVAPKVGVTAEQFRKLSGPQALQLYYDSLERAGLSQQEMTFYMESMADEATALIPLLRNGGSVLSEMSDEADNLGIVLSALDVAQLNEFAHQFDRISAILQSTGQLIAAELAPYMSELGDRMADAAADGNNLRESIHNMVESSLTVIGPLGDALHGIGIVMKGLRAFAFSVGQAYTVVFAEIQNVVTKVLDVVASGLNFVIDGVNRIPGVDDISLIASFNQGAWMQGVSSARDDMKRLAEEARQDLEDAWNAPLPSESIDQFLSDVRKKSEDLKTILSGSEQFKPLNEWLFPEPTLNAKDRETAAKAQADAVKAAAQADREAQQAADRLASSQQNLLDRLYPLEAAHRKFREDMELLDLKAAADATFNLADAQQRLNTELSRDITGGFMEQIDTGGLAKELEKTSNFAKDLGLSFTSAFEDAVIGGENFRDVLAGVAEDIQRLLIRKSITEPAVEALGGFDWGSLATAAVGLFSGSGGSAGSYAGGSPGSLYADGGYTGPGGKFDPAGIVHAGEFVIQKSVVDKPGVLPMLERLNSMPGYATGGYVGSMPNIPAGASPGVVVNVHNNGGDSQVRQQERTRPDGTRQIDVYIEQKMKGLISDGRMDRAMQGAYGVKRRPIGR